jgi:hypothetical protein
VAVEVTPLGFKKPDSATELVKRGAQVIADNAQTAEDWIEKNQAAIGIAQAKIDAGAGGPGLSADPDRPGLYYFAGPTIAPDPANPGLFTF